MMGFDWSLGGTVACKTEHTHHLFPLGELSRDDRTSPFEPVPEATSCNAPQDEMMEKVLRTDL
jgi:hypothetical protein